MPDTIHPLPNFPPISSLQGPYQSVGRSGISLNFLSDAVEHLRNKFLKASRTGAKEIDVSQ